MPACRLAVFFLATVDQGGLKSPNAQTQTHKSQSFVKVDTSREELQGLADELGVKALPAFKFFRSGREVVDHVRLVPAARSARDAASCSRRNHME